MRVCVDYTDLNKAYPKDPYPLPHIDTMVDSTAGNELLTFLDASSGFNQIQMEPFDCKKTAFITDRGIYCYLAMPFGLCNAGVTFQRLVNKMFKDKIGKIMKVYIDDMVVKSVNTENHVRDLHEVFDILGSYNIKLNSSKYNFIVSSGKFLGHMVTRRDHTVSRVLVKESEGIQSPVYHVSKSLVDAETRTTIKSQTLDDFVADFSPRQMTTAEEEFQRVIYRVYTKLLTFKAEYEALIVGLTTANDMKVKNIDVNCDSLLIVNHVNGSYEVKDPKIITYLDITKKLTNYFDTFNIQQVTRENNIQVDAQDGLGVVSKGLDLNNIPVIHITMPAVERLVHDIEVLALNQYNDNTNEDMEDWIRAYKDYLQLGVKPKNNNEAMIFRMKASRFTVIDNMLFKKSSTGLLQKCLRKHKADMVLRDAHEGECENHTNGRNLSLNILRLGYY
ncbi:uncharacterized protein LOC141680865 [Apium graveolens]|uniref:uncharacterized protein LOC141680865 n=1 Tax=Apium graveolens TaxID=4045 RepID=UPI003D7BF9B0